MVALGIIGGILLLLIFLLAAPVRIQIAASDDVTVRIRYLFWSFPYFPAPEHPTKKRRTKAPPPEPKKQTPTSKKGTLKTIRELLRHSRSGMQTLRRHTVISHVHVALCIGGNDACQTALRFGYCSQIVAVSYSILSSLFILRKPDISILPDFTSSRSRYDISLQVCIRPVFVLAAALRVLVPYLRCTARRAHTAPSARHSSARVGSPTRR